MDPITSVPPIPHAPPTGDNYINSHDDADDALLTEFKTQKGHCNSEWNRTFVFLLETFLRTYKAVLLLPWQESWGPKFRFQCKWKSSIFWNRKVLSNWATENCISLFTGFPNMGAKKIKCFCGWSRGFRYGPHMRKCNAFTIVTQSTTFHHDFIFTPLIFVYTPLLLFELCLSPRCWLKNWLLPLLSPQQILLFVADCHLNPFSFVQFSRSVVSDSLRPHELQHARPPCPSPTPGVHSNSLNKHKGISLAIHHSYFFLGF